MEHILLLLAAVIFLAAVIYAVLSRGKSGVASLLLLQEQNDKLRAELSGALNANTARIDEQIRGLSAEVTENLRAATGSMQAASGHLNQRVDNTTKIVGEVRDGLGSLRSATERVFEVGKDICGLQEILRAPKLRGGLGEFFLADLLAQLLPKKNFSLQYSFSDSSRVDAVIMLSKGMVPVDAKFPLENFRKLVAATGDDERVAARKKFVTDVKKHIDDISSSYIRPDENTFNFALMYIPAENVYYETVISDSPGSSDFSLSEYAFTKRVVPVSPATFFAYLQTILMGLRGMEVEREAGAILASLESLEGDFSRLEGDLDVLGTHLQNARTRYDDVKASASEFSVKLKGLGSGGGGEGGGELDS